MEKYIPKVFSDILIDTLDSSVIGSEHTFHQIAPYIGKIKSSIAKFLIQNFTKEGDTIFDPFCGAGTIPFEAWSNSRHVIANDLNSYAYLLTMAKLRPLFSVRVACNKIESYNDLVIDAKKKIDLRSIPKWVRQFFHRETLREILAWIKILNEKNEYFLLACLLGILHHQRPGFLSYPSSHTVPYLRTKNFPRSKYPNLYNYREVKTRLIKKVKRSFKRVPKLNKQIRRKCTNLDAIDASNSIGTVDAIVTSPPYMRNLDYARDNRLRLWFLGLVNYKQLSKKISPKEICFVGMLRHCLKIWKVKLSSKGKCILFVGDSYVQSYAMTLPDVVVEIACKEIGGFKLLFRQVSVIPQSRRIRRSCKGNNNESILVFEKL